MPNGRRADDRRHWWIRVTPHDSEQEPAATAPDESEALAAPFSSVLDEIFERQEHARANGSTVPQQRRRDA